MLTQLDASTSSSPTQPRPLLPTSALIPIMDEATLRSVSWIDETRGLGYRALQTLTTHRVYHVHEVDWVRSSHSRRRIARASGSYGVVLGPMLRTKHVKVRTSLMSIAAHSTSASVSHAHAG